MGAKQKILIIEDEIAYVKLLRDELSMTYDVVEAHDGQSGLTIAKQQHPDLILLDIRMPIMDGMDVLRALRKDPWGKTAKVFMLTNFEADDRIVVRVTKDLPIYYFVKSDVQLDQLLEKIEEVLSPKER